MPYLDRQSILPAAALAASYNNYDDDEEDDLEGDIALQIEPENF